MATLVVAALTRRVVSALSPYVPIRAGVRAVLSQAAAAMQVPHNVCLYLLYDIA